MNDSEGDGGSRSEAAEAAEAHAGRGQEGPLVEVVVLNWNRASDTLRCLDALAAGDHSNLHVTVVDNGSEDDSVETLREKARGVTLIESPVNRGFAGGCNLAFENLAADAAYVWLLNNDTVPAADALSQLVRVAERYPRVGLVGSVTRWLDDPERVQGWGGGVVSLWTGVSRHLLEAGRTPDYLTGASLLIRRELLDAVGGLDETFFFYWEDVDLSFKARLGGWSIAVAEQSVVLHDESASLGRATEAQARHLFRGLVIFLRRYARFAPVPILCRLIHHTAFAVYRRRWDALRGAWGGAWEGLRS